MMLFVAVLRLELALKFTAVAEKVAVPAPLTEDPALKLKVPAEKFSVAPEAALKPPTSVPLPERNRIPALAFTVPVLLNGMPIVSLIPPVIWNVPALLNAPVTALPNWLPVPLPFTICQAAPARV